MVPNINPTKIVIAPFTRNRKLNHWIVHAIKIEQETEADYLRIILDQKLLWNTQVENICRKLREF